MNKPLYLLITILLFLTACSSVLDKHIEYGYQQPDTYPILRAVGYAPISLQKGKTAQQKVLLAIRASKLEAYRELVEQVYGLQLTSDTQLASMVAKNDQLKAKVSGLIKGAKVVRTYALDDNYVTELTLDTKLLHDLYISQTKPRKIKRVTYY